MKKSDSIEVKKLLKKLGSLDFDCMSEVTLKSESKDFEIILICRKKDNGVGAFLNFLQTAIKSGEQTSSRNDNEKKVAPCLCVKNATFEDDGTKLDFNENKFYKYWVDERDLIGVENDLDCSVLIPKKIFDVHFKPFSSFKEIKDTLS